MRECPRQHAGLGIAFLCRVGLFLAVLRVTTAEDDALAADDAKAAASAGDSKDDGDLDLDELGDDDFEDEGDDLPESRQPPPAVEDFDLGMPEEDQKKRMKSCFVLTMNRVQMRRDQLEATVKDMTSMQQTDMTPEQALNTLIFSWMMACYMNVDATAMKQAVPGSALSVETEADVFNSKSDRQSVNQASKRQWQLLEEVLMEEQNSAETMSQYQSASGAGRAGGPGSPVEMATSLSGQSQVVYVLVVFGVIFGIGAIVIFRLLRANEKTERERSSKSLKKAEKAEKKLARKKL